MSLIGSEKKQAIPIFEEKELELNNIDIDKNVQLFLEETPTIWLLDISGSCVEKDGPDAALTLEENKYYKEVKN